METSYDLVVLGLPRGPGAVPTGRRIVALEPDPSRARRFGEMHPQVEILDAMIGGRQGPSDLIDWNLPDLRTTRSILPGFRELFPGLRETRRLEVEERDAGDLLDELAADGDRIALHLNAPGRTGAAVDALAGRGWLSRLAELTVCLGAEPLCDGDPTPDELVARLEAAGMRRASVDASDPDIPVLTFVSDPVWLDLRTRLADATAALGAERDAHARTTSELARVGEELSDKDRRLAGLEAEHAEATEALRNAREARAQADALAERRGEELTRKHTGLEAAEIAASKLRDALETARTAKARAEKIADEERRNLNITLGLQDLMKADLDELRVRYREAEAARDRQASLLRELAPRLRQVAADLQPLNHDGSDPLHEPIVLDDGARSDPDNGDPPETEMGPRKKRRKGRKASRS